MLFLKFKHTVIFLWKLNSIIFEGEIFYLSNNKIRVKNYSDEISSYRS